MILQKELILKLMNSSITIGGLKGSGRDEVFDVNF